VQFNTITPGQQQHVQRHVLHFNPHLAFHVYGFEWTPDYVAWRVDGYEVYRQTGEHIQTLRRAQKIMMNIWPPTWTDWSGTLDPSILPRYGFYDWVKYYAYTPGQNDNFTLKWVDNMNEWKPERWDKATHTWDGNNSNFIRENAVFKDGYLILCLTTPEATGYRGGLIADLDVDPPYVVWARAQADCVLVYFSEKVEPISAENQSNYLIPGATVRSAFLLPSHQVVQLQVSNFDPQQSTLLVVSNIKDRSPSSHQMSPQQMKISSALTLPVRINVGGPQVGDFLADSTWSFFQEYGAVGGNKTRRQSGSITAPANETAIYETACEGLTFYQVRVPRGYYDISLMFADAKNGNPGERVFDVIAEGDTILKNIDIIAEAGKNMALEKTITNLLVFDGVLGLYFRPKAGRATLSGLKIVPLIETGVRDLKGANLPHRFSLRVYPNPFNPSTRVVFELKQDNHVELSLYNIAGRMVRPLAWGFYKAGIYPFVLNAAGLSTGIYIVGLNIDGKLAESKKVIYVK
ncbi:MAG: glycosyl hydrolase family protein, partial [Calditrichaeota bacterium]